MAYTRPTIDNTIAKKYGGVLTADMSEAEQADFQKSADQLEHYDKIYSLIEYTS